MKARARWELKQLFGQNERRKWTFRILLPEKKKKEKRGGHMIVYLLTEWEGRTGKYLARGYGVRTERSEVRASWPNPSGPT